MKQTIEIEVPEGFKAKYNPKENKIELIKKDSKPKTWEEYCKQTYQQGKYFIENTGTIHPYTIYTNKLRPDVDKNTVCSKEEGEAFVALMQLRLLRKAWIGNWEPTYTNKPGNRVIQIFKNEFDIETYYGYSRVLSFPTKEMAEEFLECFKDLLEIAKSLL